MLYERPSVHRSSHFVYTCNDRRNGKHERHCLFLAQILSFVYFLNEDNFAARTAGCPTTCRPVGVEVRLRLGCSEAGFDAGAGWLRPINSALSLSELEAGFILHYV